MLTALILLALAAAALAAVGIEAGIRHYRTATRALPGEHTDNPGEDR